MKKNRTLSFSVLNLILKGIGTHSRYEVASWEYRTRLLLVARVSNFHVDHFFTESSTRLRGDRSAIIEEGGEKQARNMERRAGMKGQAGGMEDRDGEVIKGVEDGERVAVPRDLVLRRHSQLIDHSSMHICKAVSTQWCTPLVWTTVMAATRISSAWSVRLPFSST